MPKLQLTSPAAAVPWLNVYQVIEPSLDPPQVSLQVVPPVVLLEVVLVEVVLVELCPSHSPSRQVPVAQTLPQAPQCASSVRVSTHPSVHAVCPDGQTQLPASQAAPRGQAREHSPQWLVLESVSTQSVPHAVWPGAHAHSPSPQLC